MNRPKDMQPGEERLHELADATPTQEPALETDLAVLRRARTALPHDPERARRAWVPRRLAAWTGTAAVAMLAVAVVLQQRAPDGMPSAPSRTEPEPPAQVLHDAEEYRQRSANAPAPQAAPPPAEPMLERADAREQDAAVMGSRASRMEMEKADAVARQEREEMDASADEAIAPPPRFAGVEPPPPPEEWRAALRAWQSLGAQEVFLAELAAYQAAYPEEESP